MLAFGDSVTNCGYMPYELAYPCLVADRLREHMPVRLANWSLGGRTSRDGAALIEQAVAATMPDLVLVAFGINDAKPRRGLFARGRQVEPRQVTENVQWIVNRARRMADATVIIVLPPRCLAPDEYRDALRAAAEPPRCQIADPEALWPGDWQHDDGIHPNPVGHEAYAEAISAAIPKVPAGRRTSLALAVPPTHVVKA